MTKCGAGLEACGGGRIEGCAGATESQYAFGYPGPEWGYVLQHVEAERGNGVFNAGRHLGKDCAGGEAVALKGSEGLGEGLLADAFYLLHHAGKTDRLACLGENGHGPEGPFVGQTGDHFAGEGVFVFSLGIAEFSGFRPASVLGPMFVHGYLGVPTRQKGALLLKDTISSILLG